MISDRIGLNGQAQNLALQQGNGLPGIIVRFDATHNFNQYNVFYILFQV